MVPAESKTEVMHLAASAASATEIACWVDTKGYDYLTIDVIAGEVSAAETAVTLLELAENDTTPTDVTTDMTLIPAFTGAAATSTSAGFVLPPASSTVDNVYRFNVNLLGRKRFIGCAFTPAHDIDDGVAVIGHLHRGDVAPYQIGTTPVTTEGYRLEVSG
jgi:hypothetical protein